MHNRWTPNADKYDFGRPFPACHVVKLFQSFADDPGFPSKMVFEPGSGTGRVLIPLAETFKDWSFLGIDFSSDCVEVARKRAAMQGVTNVEFLAGLIDRDLPAAQFDFILHSSVLHVVPSWSEVMVTLCGMLSENGMFCLIGDYGDIYSAVLARNDRNGLDQQLARFWSRYNELRAEAAAPSPESTQIGCRWDLESSDLANWLTNNGFYEVMREETAWTEAFSLSQLITIVEERCYSSMFTLEQSTIDAIVTGLKDTFKFENWICTSRHNAVCRFFRPRR